MMVNNRSKLEKKGNTQHITILIVAQIQSNDQEINFLNSDYQYKTKAHINSNLTYHKSIIHDV